MAAPAPAGAGHAQGEGARPYLVLGHAHDATAVAVASLLRHRHGARAVVFRTPDDLLAAPGWEHRIDADGVATDIRLRDGTAFAAGRFAVIFNRVGFVDPPHFHDAPAVDRDYARMEWLALLLSWLASPGCPVVNRPSPGALAGSIHRPLMWARLAQIAGWTPLSLRATSSTRRFPPRRGDERRPDLSYAAGPSRPNDVGWFTPAVDARRMSLLAIGGQLPPDAPAALVAPSNRLARLADTDILRIDVAASPDSPGGWVFTGADACPHVTDTAALVRITSLLEAVAASHERTRA